MRNENFALHIRRRRFISKIICEGLVGGGCNGEYVLRIKAMRAFADLYAHITLHLLKAV